MSALRRHEVEIGEGQTVGMVGKRGRGGRGFIVLGTYFEYRHLGAYEERAIGEMAMRGGCPKFLVFPRGWEAEAYWRHQSTSVR